MVEVTLDHITTSFYVAYIYLHLKIQPMTDLTDDLWTGLMVGRVSYFNRFIHLKK